MRETSNQSWIVFVVGVLGFLGMRGIQGAAGSDAHLAADQQAAKLGASASKPVMAPGLLAALNSAAAYELRKVPPKSLQEFAQARREQSLHAVRALIVTLPDPTHTQLAWYFDQTIDALVTAAATANYTPDRSWLPWQRPNDKPDKGAQACTCCDCGEPAAASAQDDTQPGALVFRGASDTIDPSELLVVLLVGESPVVGLNRLAFVHALEEVEALTSERADVVGPFFSGSARSMADVMWATGRRPRVTTGSATGANVDRLLRSLTTFGRTVASDDAMRKFVERQLTQQIGAAPRIATLTETGTTYGAQGARSVHAAGAAGTFTFPLHIARLRQAREQENQATSTTTTVAGLRNTLELKLDDAATDDAAVPDFSSVTAAENELALRDTLTRVARGRFGYLVILATDPADFVFLAREARKYAPTTQLVAYGGVDRIVTHPDLIGDLNGLLIGSSHPMVPEIQTLVPKSFKSDLAFGVYAATRRYLSSSPQEVQDLLSPPMWLAMLANGRFWPVGVDHAHGRRASLHAPPTILAIGVTVTLFWFVLAHLLVLAVLRRAGSIPHFARRFSAAQPRLRQPQLQYAAVMLAAVSVVAAAAFVTATWNKRDSGAELPYVLALVGVVGALVLGVGACVCLLRSITLRRAGLGVFWRRRWRRSAAWRTIVAWLVASVTVVTAGLAYRFIGVLVALPNAVLALVQVRFSNPVGMNALSPIVLVATGLYLWGLFGLARVRAMDAFPAISPFPGHHDLATARLSELAARLRGLWRERIWMAEVFTGLLLMLPAAYLWFRIHPSFEAPGFDALFRLGFLALCGTVAFSIIHVVALFRALRAMLRHLAAQPMADAYDRVATKVSGSFGPQLRSRVPEPDELATSAYSIRLLASLARKVDPSLVTLDTQRVSVAADRIDATLRASQKQPEDRVLARRAHAAFFLAARSLMHALEHAWRRRVSEPELAHVAPSITAKDLLPSGNLSRVPTAAVASAAMDPEHYFFVRAAEDFVAMRVATFVAHVIDQVRLLMAYSIVGALCLLSAVTVYPFQPERLISSFAWFMVLAAMATAVFTLVSMEREEILSRLGQTRPGQVNLSVRFVSQIVVYVVLPALVVIAHMFPAFGDTVFGWLDPLQRFLQ